MEWITEGVLGCFLASFEPEDVAKKLRQALLFSREYGRTQGNHRILDLGLDAETIAREIIRVYEKALKQKNREESQFQTIE